MEPTAPTVEKTPSPIPLEKAKLTPEPVAMEELSAETVAELNTLSFKILGPLRMPEAGMIVEVVTESIRENPRFMTKWGKAKNSREKEILLDELYSKVPEVKKAQMGRELMLTIGVLMQSSKLATKFTPELSGEILDAVYDQGWSEANEALREKIVVEVLVSDSGNPKKTKEEIIQGFLEQLKK